MYIYMYDKQLHNIILFITLDEKFKNLNPTNVGKLT